MVLWSHGLHEHLGRFEKLHEALVAKNVAVYAWDHVGHGESGSCGEKRHQFPRGFDAVVADALQFARCETRQTRGIRKTRAHPTRGFVSSRASRFFQLFLLSDLQTPRARPVTQAGARQVPGGRRGSRFRRWRELRRARRRARVRAGVGVRAALRRVRPRAPCCDVEWTPLLRFQASIGAFRARVAPDVRGAAAVTPDRLSSDPAAIEAYVSDPLVCVAHVRFLAATEIMKGFDALREDAFYDDAEWKHAHVVMHTADAACFFPASEAFVKRVHARDKTFLAIKNGSHLLLHDAATAESARGRLSPLRVYSRRGVSVPKQSRQSPRRRAARVDADVARYGDDAGAVTEAAEVDIGARL